MKSQKKKQTDNCQDLLTKVAAMYYLDCMSQEEIAKSLFLSRSTVSRMLKQAKDENVVSIKINFAPGRHGYYENKIQQLFDVEAMVINTIGMPETEIKTSLCKCCAVWIDEKVKDNYIIGTTRGSLLSTVAGYLTHDEGKHVSVVQLMGSESRSAASLLSAQDVVRQLAANYDGVPYFIDAPLVFFNEKARNELMKVSSIHTTLTLAKQANLVLTTLPRIIPNNSEHIWKGFIDEATYDEVVKLGAVGCLFGRAFDINGRYLDVELNRSIVSADVEALKQKHIVAICYGSGSAKATLGAIRGGYIKTLVTDAECIEALLALDKTL